MPDFRKLPSADDRFACCVEVFDADVFDALLWGNYLYADFNSEQLLLFFSSNEQFDQFVAAVEGK